MLMVVVHSRGRWTVRLGLLVTFAGLLSSARGAQILGFPLNPGDTGAGGTVVSERLRAQRKRKATLETLTRTVRLLVVLVEEMMELPTSGAFAAFHAICRAGTGARRLLHQQLLAHHTPLTVNRGIATFKLRRLRSNLRSSRTRPTGIAIDPPSGPPPPPYPSPFLLPLIRL